MRTLFVLLLLLTACKVPEMPKDKTDKPDAPIEDAPDTRLLPEEPSPTPIPTATPVPTATPEPTPTPTPDPRLSYLEGTWVNLSGNGDEFTFTDTSGSQTTCGWTFDYAAILPMPVSQAQFSIYLTHLHGLNIPIPCKPFSGVWHQERECNVLILSATRMQMACLYDGARQYERVQ